MIVTRGHILGYFYPPALLAMFSVFSNFYGWRSESSNLRIKPCPTHAESRRKDVFDLNLEQSLIRILFLISKKLLFCWEKIVAFWWLVVWNYGRSFKSLWNKDFTTVENLFSAINPVVIGGFGVLYTRTADPISKSYFSIFIKCCCWFVKKFFREEANSKKKYSRMGSLIFVCEIWTKACFSKLATIAYSF